MPYKVIGENCRVGGRVIPKGTTLADNQIIGGAASALLAANQIVSVNPAPAAPATSPAAQPSTVTPPPAPAKVQSGG